MSIKKVWEVDIDIMGSICISDVINFKQEKGFDQQQFYSDIHLENSSTGINATITAYAVDSQVAEIVAHVFFGKMVDVLSLNNNIPLVLVSHDDGVFTGGKINTRRRLEKSDFIEAFNMARKFEIEEPILLKAIGWYSKGKYTSNMLDKFVAYWNAIEIIGKAYHHENERTRQGVKNKIYQCFIECYGEVENWNLPDNWIDDMHDMRSCIVHGGKDTTAEAINEVAQLIPKMESVTYELINKIIDAKYDRKNFEYIPWGELF